MTGVRIFVEGGGSTSEQRNILRRGFDEFFAPLRQLASDKDLTWKVDPCGSRGETYKEFRKAAGEAGILPVLLVDSESPVTASVRAHLARQDHWDLSFALDRQLHLMEQTMETWLVADPDTVNEYYGPDFLEKLLPRRANLEEAPKADVANALKRATERTKKGRYDKINHAAALLPKLDRDLVRRRCARCDRLFLDVAAAIESAAYPVPKRSRRRRGGPVREPMAPYSFDPADIPATSPDLIPAIAAEHREPARLPAPA